MYQIVFGVAGYVCVVFFREWDCSDEGEKKTLENFLRCLKHIGNGMFFIRHSM